MKVKKFKKPNLNWRKIGVVSAWVVSIVALGITLGFVGKGKNAVKCTGVVINISDENGNEFITKNDVLDLLNSRGKQPVGKHMNDINTAVLEKLVNTNPFVANAEVYSTIDGTVNIDIRQRNPIVRIINNKDEHFYIDEEGNYMPVSSNYTAQVMVINGNISDTYTDRKVKILSADDGNDTVSVKPLMTGLFQLAQFINNDPFWNAQLEQVYVNENSEIELIPRLGNHRIIFGDATALEAKFRKLMIFYKQGLNKTGWNDYSVINLKFNNQVVCTKINTETKQVKNKPN